MFIDRIDAALKLAHALASYKASNAVILAIPRGGVPVAITIGQQLDLPVDIVLAKKIGHPLNRELAIGAVCSTDTYLYPRFPVTPVYVCQEQELIRALLRERELEYRTVRSVVPLEGRPVILVDDGIATGHTMRAAIALTRRSRASQVIVAAPVAARETANDLRALVDEVVCLEEPVMLNAIGAHYQDFAQISDKEVMEWLSTSTQGGA